MRPPVPATVPPAIACGNAKKPSRFTPRVAAGGVRARNRDRRTRRVVVRVGERHRDAQAVRAAALEDRDDDVTARRVVLRHDDLRQPRREQRGRPIHRPLVARNWRRDSSLYSWQPQSRSCWSSIVSSGSVPLEGVGADRELDRLAHSCVVERAGAEVGQQAPSASSTGISPPKKLLLIMSIAAAAEPAQIRSRVELDGRRVVLSRRATHHSSSAARCCPTNTRSCPGTRPAFPTRRAVGRGC